MVPFIGLVRRIRKRSPPRSHVACPQFKHGIRRVSSHQWMSRKGALHMHRSCIPGLWGRLSRRSADEHHSNKDTGQHLIHEATTPFPPWSAGNTSYDAPAFNQSQFISPATSPTSSSDSVRLRMNVHLSASDRNEATNRPIYHSSSTMDSTLSYDSFTQKPSIGDFSVRKPASVEVSVDSRRP
ncbi:hypothetical protein HPB51_008154 [Rhipicephalus microplus]|uniref:Uncharacterized protein n=1 Tax=Rhipicephalus microplus TaxID=6941 RepID=A0A9J6D4F5_RHIMP|nr:hypothetical protein HPB51_008154 [Rhipicephalus microplus]